MSSRGRGLRLGLGLALLAWAGLALLDGGYGAFLSPLSFETPGERLWFLLLCALSLLGPAILLGLCQGALGPLLMAMARRLARSSSRARTAPWLGRLLALLCAPAVAAVCAQIFRGPRAQRIPGHDLIAVGLGVVALYALSAAVPALLRLREWVDESGPRRRQRALLIGGALWLLCAMLYAADARVLPRLYPWFHASLLALVLTTAELGALFCALGATGLRRRWLNEEHLALLVTLVAVCAGAWGLLRLDRAQVLRAAAMEHTALAGRVLVARHLVFSGPGPGRGAEGGLSDAVSGADESAGEGGPREALPPGPRLEDSDVFLITVDALRDDRLGERTMPAAAALARGGVRFERAYTQVPHTSFAVATLLTGKPVYALLALGQDAAEHETLPTVLRRARYKTAAFYPPSVFFIEHERLKRLEESSYGFEYVKYEYLDAKRRTDQVIDFLLSERPARAFVWVHYLDPHEPYDVHPGGPGAKPGAKIDGKASDRDRYDGEVRFVDEQIARLLAHLRATRPRALIVLGADHGEEFGEHGGRYHGTTLYEEQVRVPLVFADLAVPSRLPARRAPGPVGLIDVAPTILRLLDIAPSARMRGHDLGPWLGPSPGPAAPPPWPVFGEIGRKKMVVQGADKLICDLSTDTCASYDLARDPGESRNLIDAAPARAGALREQLRRYLSEASRFESAAAPGVTTMAATAAATIAAEDRDALVRGRLGDRGAAAGLSRLILREGLREGADPVLQQEAVALLAQLCLQGEAGEDARAALRRGAAGDARARRWAQVGLAALGQPMDQSGGQSPLGEIIRDEQADPGLRVAAAQALVVNPAAAPDRVALLVAALPVAMALDDPDRARPLIQALGQGRDPRALPALLAQLDNVRSRVDVTRALGALGQRQAVPALSRLLLGDPYVPVRAAAAEALGALGPTPASTSALSRAARREREAPVQEAIQAAQAGRRRPPERPRPPG